MTIASNDILSRKMEIKGYVATAKLELAVKRCMDFCEDFGVEDDEEAILLSTTLNYIIADEKKGQMTRQEARVERQQLAKRILITIKELSEAQLQA